jgi:hypothetical protein
VVEPSTIVTGLNKKFYTFIPVYRLSSGPFSHLKKLRISYKKKTAQLNQFALEYLLEYPMRGKFSTVLMLRCTSSAS